MPDLQQLEAELIAAIRRYVAELVARELAQLDELDELDDDDAIEDEEEDGDELDEED
jgi:hypothetical protein